MTSWSLYDPGATPYAAVAGSTVQPSGASMDTSPEAVSLVRSQETVARMTVGPAIRAGPWT